MSKRIPPKKRRDLGIPKHSKDNYARRYSRPGVLEGLVREAIRKERDEWRRPYYIMDLEDGRHRKVYNTPDDNIPTIRERLQEPDANFRGTSIAQKFHPRVPSLKRSNREWVNFYRTFSRLAVDVAIGEERFAGGAKLRYIPLFKKILDEEWPEDLKMWTEEQYEELIQKGLIKPL